MASSLIEDKTKKRKKKRIYETLCVRVPTQRWQPRSLFLLSDLLAISLLFLACPDSYRKGYVVTMLHWHLRACHLSSYPAIPGNCFSATVPRQKSHRFSGIERFNENALESARQEFSSASRRVPLEFPTGCEREKLSQVKNDSENLETDTQRRI